jgi:hypothetical protein
VPRYFFHFSDGKRQFTDGVGQELGGMAAVRRHAQHQIRELKAALCDPHIQDLSDWSMIVADAGGKTVFAMRFDLRPLDSG